MQLYDFYENVEVCIDPSTERKRLKLLVDNVISRLPEEPQFRLRAAIVFKSRLEGMKFWNKVLSKRKLLGLPPAAPPPFDIRNVDGHSSFEPRFARNKNSLDSSSYILTFFTDAFGGLRAKSDNYIKGLIVHEFAEMSYKYRRLEKELPSLCAISDYEILSARVQALCYGNIKWDDPKYPEHEAIADEESIRLGFAEETRVLRQQALLT